MQRFYINGGNQLSGEVKIQSGKNALLPILAGCILVDGIVELVNVPRYTDIDAMIEILEHLGAVVTWNDDNLIIDTRVLSSHDVTIESAGKLRASIFTLGSILARMKLAKLAYPGGCNIGLRPIDLHISGMRMLGAKVNEKNGFIYANGTNMNGGDIVLDLPSVGATENIMMAGVLTKGTTRIFNPAKEPEIVDLQNFLNKCGAKISGAGSNLITIEGVKSLAKNIKYEAMPDRIVTGTLLIAGAMCGGKIVLKNVKAEHNQALIAKLAKSACQFDIKDDKIKIYRPARLKSFGEVETLPYPGIPTDLQAPIMALQAISEGTTILIENLFEARFKHVPELIKMGADIKFKGNVCIIRGKEKLYGAEVKACDLRGGAGLVLAGLAAEGYTTIGGIEYIDRGYYKFEEMLRTIGADIRREDC